ncbi:MAG TPA: hypothetical protein VFY63_02160 [Pseudorhizobium sp.]|nr:hypothetical protein [Pseudorhizobium sp.]
MRHRPAVDGAVPPLVAAGSSAGVPRSCRPMLVQSFLSWFDDPDRVQLAVALLPFLPSR